MWIHYRTGYKYQTSRPYYHRLKNGIESNAAIDTEFLSLRDGILTIKPGYAWDGPSGPTIDTKNFMRGSLVHDALYQLIREGHLPRDAKVSADNELRDVCIEDGMTRARAWWVHLAVHRFGHSATISSRQEYCAP